MASTNKKVELVRFDRTTLEGFVQVPEGLSSEHIELLTPAGGLTRVPFSETKAVCFVRDFSGGQTFSPNRPFLARPKTAGLWVRLHFRDGDWMEATLPNNLTLLDPSGFSVTPPDASAQLHRIFVPRVALSRFEVLGVIGSSARRRPAKPVDKDKQITMFE